MMAANGTRSGKTTKTGERKISRKILVNLCHYEETEAIIEPPRIINLPGLDESICSRKAELRSEEKRRSDTFKQKLEENIQTSVQKSTELQQGVSGTLETFLVGQQNMVSKLRTSLENSISTERDFLKRCEQNRALMDQNIKKVKYLIHSLNKSTE